MASLALGVKFTATSAGTGDFVYASAVTGYVGPAATLPAMADGKIYRYRAESADLTQWEFGFGAYTAASQTIARTNITLSSTGAKVSFSAAPFVGIVPFPVDVIAELQNISFAISAAAGALTIALKDAYGNDPSVSSPVALSFRNVSLTASPNVPITLEVVAATSVVVPSTSTLGTTSARACRLWIIGWNDGATFRLGVFNACDGSNIFPLVESGLGSSLQVVAAGNAAGQHYTAGAAVTSKAFRILGYIEWNSSGVATAGTWTTTNLGIIQTFGPGVRKPGESVQKITFTSTTGSTSSSSTFTASSLTKAITPTSAANLIRAVAVAPGLSGGSGTVGNTQWGRNSNANMFGGMGAVNSATGANYSSTNPAGIDFPNSTASTTYTVYQKSSDNVTNFSVLPNSYVGSIELEEIMA